jgi:pimeloyl-ACP methyl ester carboxylesterase
VTAQVRRDNAGTGGQRRQLGPPHGPVERKTVDEQKGRRGASPAYFVPHQPNAVELRFHQTQSFSACARDVCCRSLYADTETDFRILAPAADQMTGTGQQMRERYAHIWRGNGGGDPCGTQNETATAPRRLTVETAEGPASYIAAGSGPPVVLLHGLDGSSRWWAPTIGLLSQHFRCYALEFVVGWREDGRVALPRASAFVTAWMTALGLDWAHLVAHSMGGYSACEIAITQPERIGRLVLVAPAVAPPHWMQAGDTGRLRLGFFGLAPNFLPVLIADTFRTGPWRWLRSARELHVAHPLQVETIAAPTLLIWGARDPLVPATEGPPLCGRIPDARLLTLPRAHHVPMYESPDTCNSAILRFLTGG